MAMATLTHWQQVSLVLPQVLGWQQYTIIMHMLMKNTMIQNF
jgi:hypothetical protein